MTDRLQIRRVLLEAFVDPERVIERPDRLPVVNGRGESYRELLPGWERNEAEVRGFVEIGEPEPEFCRFTIVSEGGPGGHSPDASIELDAAIASIAAKHNITGDAVLRMIAVSALRAAARSE
jgi:hypothetical protein